ncbi:MFS transporter [Sulfitobacter sp. BDSS02]|nr:MFS transporter [Sulfitobacter sp. BDSS02]MBR9848030.1 MFS transporter [Paracoccaceae bacterium]
MRRAEPRDKWQNMGLVEDIRISRAPALGFVAMALVWGCFAAQVPVIKAQIGASDAAYGASFLVSSIGAISAMWLAPRVDRRLGALSLALSSAAMIACMLFVSFSSLIAVFTFGMFLTAAASGIADILLNTRIAESEAQRGRPLMNLNHAVYSFSFAGAALVTGMAREAGFTPVQVFCIVAAVIWSLCFLMVAPHRHTAGEPALSAAAGRVIVWLAGLVFLVGFMAEQAVEGWSALHLERTLGGGAAQGALGPAVLGVTMGIGRIIGQSVAARLSETVIIAAACTIAAIGTATAALAPTLIVAYIGFSILGLGVSVVVPISMALIGRVVPQSDRVAAIGRASVVGYGAFLFGPSMMGLTADLYGLRASFLLLAIMLLLVAAVLVPAMNRRLRGGRSSGAHPHP